jgi:DNA polymerase-3 subunit epsilon
VTNWFGRGLTAFDVETTGVDVESDRIVTASIVHLTWDCQITPFSWLINPGVEIPEATTAVHGITTEMAATIGEDPSETLARIACQLAIGAFDGEPLVGMNLAFDLTILDRECRRHGAPTFGERLALERDSNDETITPVIDVFVIDKAVDRFRRGGRKLVDLCEFYNVSIDNAHNSESDAIAAARVVWRMWQRSQMTESELLSLYADRRYPSEMVSAWQSLGRMTMAELHEAQKRWAAEQARSFGQYLQQQANEATRRAESAGDDESRAVAEQEVTELNARIDGLDGSWPLRHATRTDVTS